MSFIINVYQASGSLRLHDNSKDVFSLLFLTTHSRFHSLFCRLLVITSLLAEFRVWLPGTKHHASVLVMNKDSNQQQPESFLNEAVWQALGGGKGKESRGYDKVVAGNRFRIWKIIFIFKEIDCLSKSDLTVIRIAIYSIVQTKMIGP